MKSGQRITYSAPWKKNLPAIVYKYSGAVHCHPGLTKVKGEEPDRAEPLSHQPALPGMQVPLELAGCAGSSFQPDLLLPTWHKQTSRDLHI